MHKNPDEAARRYQLQNNEKFIDAATNGLIDLMSEYLNKNQVHVDCVDKHGFTALMRAAQSNQLEASKLLLTHSCSVDLQNKEGWTALLWAAFKGYDDIVGTVLLTYFFIHLLTRSIIRS